MENKRKIENPLHRYLHTITYIYQDGRQIDFFGWQYEEYRALKKFLAKNKEINRTEEIKGNNRIIRITIE